MSKATLTFTLPEEQEEFELANNAANMHSALTDLYNLYRNNVKYGGDPNTTWEEVRTQFFEILNENDVELF